MSQLQKIVLGSLSIACGVSSGYLIRAAQDEHMLAKYASAQNNIIQVDNHQINTYLFGAAAGVGIVLASSFLYGSTKKNN